MLLAMPFGTHPRDESPGTASQRARELYKYFSPNQKNFSTSKQSAADTVLTAHAQLLAWRLNVRRAMVSLIDRDTQYFVAESSKTLALDDTYARLETLFGDGMALTVP
jgi:hypothetical protein